MEEEAELKEKPIGSASLEESVVKAAPHKNGKTYASSENEVEKLLSLDDGPDDGNLISYDDEPPMANPYGRDYFDQYGAGADELLNFDESEFEARSNPVESPLGSEEFVTLDKPVDLITPVEEKPSVTTADYEEYDDKNWLKDKEENDHESEDTILAFGNELDDFAAAVARKALRASTNPTALPAQTFESLKRLSPSRSSPDKSVPTAGLRCYNRLVIGFSYSVTIRFKFYFHPEMNTRMRTELLRDTNP